MKRNLINPILRYRPSCGNHYVTSQSIRALVSNGASSRTYQELSQGKSTIYTTADHAKSNTYITSYLPSFFCGAITMLFGASIAFDPTLLTSRSYCEASQNSIDKDLHALESSSESDSATQEDIPLLATKPLWPDGVSKEDVDALVEIILEDPNINIQLIPDSIEAIVYKSAVQLTLNIFYRLLAKLNGVPLLSHQIQVARLIDEEEIKSEEKKGWFSSTFGLEKPPNDSIKKEKYRRIAEAAALERSAIDDNVLEKIAARLLENQTVNNAYIPDAFEIYLYQSCLKVVFRALKVLSHTFHINLCGHDICLLIEPSALEQSALTAANSASTTLDGKIQPKSRWMDSEIDMKVLEDFAQKAGIDKNGYLHDENLSWWDWWWLKRRRDMIANLHASLLALILGIADDILQYSNIQILSDNIYLDITPARTNSDQRTEKVLSAGTKKVDSHTSKRMTSSMPSFVLGVGVGAVMMALFGTQ